nr:hypothetical protein [Tanacetum cinerariifolium]
MNASIQGMKATILGMIQMLMDDSNVILDSSDMNPCKGKVGQHSGKDEDERVLLASLIENLKVDIDENTNIHNDLKKANMSLTLELNQSKLDLRDSKIELSRYKFCHTNHKEKEEAKLKCNWFTGRK